MGRVISNVVYRFGQGFHNPQKWEMVHQCRGFKKIKTKAVPEKMEAERCGCHWVVITGQLIAVATFKGIIEAERVVEHQPKSDQNYWRNR